MPGTIVTPSVNDPRKVLSLPIGFVKSLLESAKTPIWVAERSGRVLLSNGSAREYLGPEGTSDASRLNLFTDLLRVESKWCEEKSSSALAFNGLRSLGV
jgi:PAS domain-containing protein